MCSFETIIRASNRRCSIWTICILGYNIMHFSVRQALFKYGWARRLFKHPLILERPDTPPYSRVPYSPHLRFVDYRRVVKKYSAQLRRQLQRPITVISVGGGASMKEPQARLFPPDSDFTILDLERVSNTEKTIRADICDPSFSINRTFDIVFSKDAFEHFRYPWIAARNCLALSTSGGLQIHVAPFAWRYHSAPGDFFRYTHHGFEALFESDQRKCSTLLGAYDITRRRGTLLQQHGRHATNIPPQDELGGFLENWRTIYVCRVI